MRELTPCRILSKNGLRLDITSQDKDNYIFKMFTSNQIDGMVTISERTEDNEQYLIYNTEGLKPIESIYKVGMMSLEDTSDLIFSVCKEMNRIKKYLLPNSGLVLSEKYIFFNLDSLEFRFIYLPITDSSQQMTLPDFLISVIDHSDDDLVSAVYDAYSIRNDEYWPEFLKTKLIEVSERRRDEKRALEIQTPIPVPKESHEEYSEEPVMENVKKKEAICSALIYLVILFVILFELLDTYYFEFYEVTIMVFLSLFVTGLAGIIIAKKFMPSLYSKMKKRGKEEKAERTFIPDKRWYGNESTKEDVGETIFMEASKPKNILYGQGLNKTNISLDKLPITIGRQEGMADVFIDDPNISRLHLRIFEHDNRIYVEDLNSTNGSIKNGLRLIPGEAIPLNPEDTLVIGNKEFVYY